MSRLLRAAAVAIALPLLATGAGGCGSADGATGGGPRVIASATYLADIAQHVAGERIAVRALIPADVDLHSYEPGPRELADIVEADTLIVNGGGLEQALEDTVRSAGGGVVIVEASAGLEPRSPQSGEPAADDDGSSAAGETDPHFWLDPVLVKTYVENIREALAAADPSGADVYAANAAAYTAELDELDAWIRGQVDTVPAADRKLVMNHVSHGYFADRYGFEIVGAVIPSVSTGDTPTARQLADLTRAIRDAGAKAIFVELGEDAALAEQVAAETGVAVVTGLRDHALSGPDGEAPTYVDMMKYDTRRIVEALR